jgi:fumarate reductase subunit D
MSEGPPQRDEKSRPDEIAISEEQLTKVWALARVIAATTPFPVAPVGVVTALRSIWVAVVAGLCGFFLLAPDEASKEFYTAVAGTIPVLLLALVVIFELPTGAHVKAELFAALRKPDEPTLLYLPRTVPAAIKLATKLAKPLWRLLERTLFGVGLLVLLIAGEFAALHPLATGVADDGNPRVTYAAVAAGLAVVASLALIGSLESRGPRRDREPPSALPGGE